MSKPAKEMILVLDFGGQYNQLIARRVREEHVYCEVHPHTLSLEKIREMAPKGIILTGGPNSVYKNESATCSPELFKLGIPVLGICYGSQLMAHLLGGKVDTAPTSEYGKTEVQVDKPASKLFHEVDGTTVCWMSHTDYIAAAPAGLTSPVITCLRIVKEGISAMISDNIAVVPKAIVHFGIFMSRFPKKAMVLPFSISKTM